MAIISPKRMSLARRALGHGVIRPHRLCPCGETLGPGHDGTRCHREYQARLDAELLARKRGHA